MSNKRIAIIGFPASYFLGFGDALEQVGFDVYWVHASRSAAREHMGKLKGNADRIVDSTENFDPVAYSREECERGLHELEAAGGLRIHDIILMDRVLRDKSYSFALRYLYHCQKLMTKFFTDNAIGLINSGRDTALCLTAMLVGRKLGIPWVVPTRIRIPREMFMFCSGHETDSTACIRAPNAEDRAWAEQFLTEFEQRAPKPVLKAAAAEFTDVLQMIPQHASLFLDLLTRAADDRGNDYSRYTIGRIIRMYTKRRLNMLRFKVFPPHASVGDRPFCIYALHTQPESSIDVAGSYFSNQIALITIIARSLPVSHELYVKIHQTDVDGKPLAFYQEIAKIPGVRLINYDVNSRDLIDRASIVFVLTGTIGYEAGLLGKPVVAFAKNYYNGMPTVHYCDAPPRLPELIESLLDTPRPAEWRDRLLTFLADLRSRSFRGEFNRMWQQDSQHLSPEDLTLLQGAYVTLYERLHGSKAN